MKTENKDSSEKKSIKEKWQNINDEKWLRFIANIFLFAGIGISIYVLSFMRMTVQEAMYSANGDVIGNYSKSEFNAQALLITLAILLGSFLIWSFLRVVSNISNSLKEINRK